MSTGTSKPGVGATAPTQGNQKKVEKDPSSVQNSGESGGADAQVGASSAALLGVLPVFEQADTSQSFIVDDPTGAPAPDANGVQLSSDGAGTLAPSEPSAAVFSSGSQNGAADPFGPPSSSPAPIQLTPRTPIDAPSTNTDANIPFETPQARSGEVDAATPRGNNENVAASGSESTTFSIPTGLGGDTITGGEGGSLGGIDASVPSGPVTVTYTADEAGTIFDGAETITFEQVERLTLTDGADSVDAQTYSIATDFHIDTGAGNDTVSGYAGNETVLAGAGDDLLDMQGGDDSVETGTGNDTVYGGAGDDIISNVSGADSVFGGDDADTLQIASDFDGTTFAGGEGGDDRDVIDVSDAAGPVTVTYSGDEEGVLSDGT
ncbi:MAG: hypothetical protein ABJQ89_21015, partial [Planktotalea sp.]